MTPIYLKTSDKRRVSNKHRSLEATQSCQMYQPYTVTLSFLSAYAIPQTLGADTDNNVLFSLAIGLIQSRYKR